METYARNVKFFEKCKQTIRKTQNFSLFLPSYPSTTFNRNLILFTKYNDFTTASQKN